MLNKKDLFERLENIDDILDDKFDLVAVGGTAMVLRGLKGETRDVDFIVENGDPFTFKHAYVGMYDDKIDVSSAGACFQVDMPSDYMNHAEYERSFENITLYKLSLIDMIITKSTRFLDRDRDDILLCSNVNGDINGNMIMNRLRRFSLNNDELDNVKRSLIEIFNMSESDVENI